MVAIVRMKGVWEGFRLADVIAALTNESSEVM